MQPKFLHSSLKFASQVGLHLHLYNNCTSMNYNCLNYDKYIFNYLCNVLSFYSIYFGHYCVVAMVKKFYDILEPFIGKW